MKQRFAEFLQRTDDKQDMVDDFAPWHWRWGWWGTKSGEPVDRLTFQNMFFSMHLNRGEIVHQELSWICKPSDLTIPEGVRPRQRDVMGASVAYAQNRLPPFQEWWAPQSGGFSSSEESVATGHDGYCNHCEQWLPRVSTLVGGGWWQSTTTSKNTKGFPIL